MLQRERLSGLDKEAEYYRHSTCQTSLNPAYLLKYLSDHTPAANLPQVTTGQIAIIADLGPDKYFDSDRIHDKKKRGLGSALKLPPKGGWRKYEKTFNCIKCISIF
jgi:hypothetical protein